MTNIAFIVGSARSGTTILGEIFNNHSQIAQWYEPYYLWRKYFSCKDNEIWLPEELNDRVKTIIQKEHEIFLKKAQKELLVEKMPSHSFNIPLILNIFPDAKWIHIIRDGRDITLSMKKEWQKREQIVAKKNYLNAFKAGYKVIKRAPYLRNKFQLFVFEMTSNASLRPSKYLNKAKWKGNVGWGPRFEGWEDHINKLTPLQFNAMQWVKTVEAVQSSWHLIDDNNKIQIQYEELMQNPLGTLQSVLSLLGYPADDVFFHNLPSLKQDNFNKWKNEFTAHEISQIKPILSPLLERLGYAEKIPW